MNNTTTIPPVSRFAAAKNAHTTKVLHKIRDGMARNIAMDAAAQIIMSPMPNFDKLEKAMKTFREEK